MSEDMRFKIPIPKGYRIYYGIDVAGVSRRLDALSRVLKKGSVTFELMPEPENKHDKNAVMVQAKRNGFFGMKTELIGYVPKDQGNIAFCVRVTGKRTSFRVRRAAYQTNQELLIRLKLLAAQRGVNWQPKTKK